MCKLPVTLGGGEGMTNWPSGLLLPSGVVWGLKKPCAAHQSYHADSTAIGLYPLAIGCDTSSKTSIKSSHEDRKSSPFFSPFGVVLKKAGSSSFFSFSTFAFFSPAGVEATTLAVLAASLASFSNRFASFLARSDKP